MLLVLLTVLAMALRFFIQGEIAGLAAVRIRAEAFLIAVFVLALALPMVSRAIRLSQTLLFSAWLLLIGLLLCACVLNGMRNQGFRVMATGVALNFLVIAANRAMPVVSEAVMSIAGASGVRAIGDGDPFHLIAQSSAHLVVLADVLPLPGPPGLRAVLSLGDLLMFVGMLIVVVSSGSLRCGRSAQRLTSRAS